MLSAPLDLFPLNSTPLLLTLLLLFYRASRAQIPVPVTHRVVSRYPLTRPNARRSAYGPPHVAVVHNSGAGVQASHLGVKTGGTCPSQ